MDIDKARKQMADHIDGQAKYQGQIVAVRFLREDTATGAQIFELEKGDKTAEIGIAKEDLALRPHRIMAIDEQIAGALEKL